MIKICFHTMLFCTFVAAPSNVTINGLENPVNHGSTATLTGSYFSLLNATMIKWQKLNNSVFVDINTTEDKYVGSSTEGLYPRLVIKSIKFSDGTSYRLMVSNGVRYSFSSGTQLTVTGMTQ